MGILDEAIKEHLELKRQHGAGDSELQQLEDEAFGAAERPGDEEPQSDATAEAPTEFMSQPEAPEGDAEPAAQRPTPQIADRQEAPPLEPEPPAEEDAPAMEHEAVAEPEPEDAAEPEPPAGPSTEERHAIAEQPTEMFDVEEELAAESSAPTEEELVEEATAEPRLAPIDPLADIEEPVDESAEIQVEEVDDEADDLDDEFWDEKRLSDELDQALEAPRESEPEEPEPPVGESEPEEAEPRDESTSEQPSPSRDEDVLEETPDFLEEAPEDDQLWFEQKPPKDFDFDD